MHLTLKQGADFSPAHDASPTGVLAECCLQHKQWNATGHQKEDVRNEECTCNDNLAVFDQKQVEQCLSDCLSVRIHLTHLNTQHMIHMIKKKIIGVPILPLSSFLCHFHTERSCDCVFTFDEPNSFRMEGSRVDYVKI